MNILLVNLTRFGDLLQTQPLISGLKKAGHSVGLVCLDNFAGAADLLRDVDHVTALKGGRALSLLESDWRDALGEIWEWCEKSATRFTPDMVLNVTATLSVRLLSRRMTPQGSELRGFAVDENGFGVNTDPWTTFLQASTRLRGCSPFNLVDLYRMSAGLGDGPLEYRLREPDAETRAQVQSMLGARLHEARTAFGIPDSVTPKGYVAFQLGASEDRRQWPVGYFAALGQRLWREEGRMPVLLGASGEQHLADAYAKAAKNASPTQTPAPFISLVGGTTLPQLAAALMNTDMLVSNDTGTMHLAAGLSVPVLAIFLATAQPWDTGPYLEGSCSLEPDLPCHPCPFGKPCSNEHACRTRISPENVFSLASGWLREGRWTSPSGSHVDEARIWISCRDNAGFMNLHSISGHEESDRTRWVRLQRHFYSQFLDRPAAQLLDPNAQPAPYRQPAAPIVWPAPAGIEHQPAVNTETPAQHDMRATVAAELMQSAQLLHLMNEQGTVLAHRPVEAIKKRFLGTWQRLQTMWDNSKYLNVLGFMWMCESQEAGQNLGSALALARQYQALTEAWLAAVQDK